MNSLIEAFFLGLTGGVVPGSILTILLISVLQGGFKAGLRAFAWCLTAEILIVTLLLTIILNIQLPPQIFSYVGVIGSLVLFYFAWQITKLSKIEQTEDDKKVFTGLHIFILSATNAPLYLFWITVCTPLIWQLSGDMSLVNAAVTYTLLFEVGWALSTFVILVLFVTTKHILTNPKIMSRVYLGIALFMSFIGCKILYTSVTQLINF